MNKAVLVSFKERNKVLHISSSTSNEGEITCLKKQFCRTFSENISEGQLITFQRFDSAWDSFIDLDDRDTIEDRDKLKVVITELTQHKRELRRELCQTATHGKDVVNPAAVASNSSTLHLTHLEHSVSA